MKTLQNNFTTPEQSKDLLALGLPAESADMCYRINDDTKKYMNTPTAIPWRKYTANRFYLPCWSVGCLQEIAKICAKEKEYYYASLDAVAHQEDFVEWWVKHFTSTDNVLFDFSKLEEYE